VTLIANGKTGPGFAANALFTYSATGGSGNYNWSVSQTVLPRGSYQDLDQLNPNQLSGQAMPDTTAIGNGFSLSGPGNNTGRLSDSPGVFMTNPDDYGPGVDPNKAPPLKYASITDNFVFSVSVNGVRCPTVFWSVQISCKLDKQGRLNCTGSAKITSVIK
jgi:hypothetical protein